MILGLSLSAFTTLHVVISLVAIAAGGIVVWGLLRARALPRTTAAFLATTIFTSASGFLFPSTTFGAPHVVGVLSLVLLAVAMVALYVRRLTAHWRALYVITAIASLYLNVFVGVTQAFQKIRFLQALAPTQTEPSFAVAHGLTLIVFVVLGILAVKRFYPLQHQAYA